ncbi:MAG: flagellar brake protein [Methylobacter sp.]|nr:flagellar brake protein [Methylobacter sp.]
MSEASSYSVFSPRQIIYNLSILIKNRCLLSVRFGEGQAFFLTAILEIDQKNNAVIFDYGPKEALNQQLLKSDKITFQADFSGIKASFNGIMLAQTLYNGEPAFTMPIPESIFWMQRREYFRIKSPRSKGSYCQLTVGGQKAVDLLLYDISLTGFSVLNTSPEISNLLVSGAQFKQCRLVLSGTGEDAIDFKVCAKFVINPDKIAVLKIQKIGCLFTRITPVFETTVQHYINQLQRESIQKMND